jgi:uncharacterized membrane protein
MSETAGGPGVRWRTPRGVLALLVVSLAANLLVVGLVGGAAWRFRHGPPPHLADTVAPNLLGYASTLKPERRKQLWDSTAEERRNIRPFRRDLRAARNGVVEAITAEPFDRQRFETAQRNLVEVETAARRAAQALYVQMAVAMTAEERRAFAEWRERRRPPGHNLLDEPDQPAAK